MNGSESFDFQGQCGECTDGFFSVSSSGMQVFQSATVNGGPVNDCIVGNDGATIFGISLTKTEGIYSYQVAVDGQGPSGFGSGSIYLAFTDETGDTYYLSIYSGTRETHTVDYNSDSPAITRISWSDYSFDVSDIDVGNSSRAKPEYRITSPAK